jgi:hypothetical protein
VHGYHQTEESDMALKIIIGGPNFAPTGLLSKNTITDIVSTAWKGMIDTHICTMQPVRAKHRTSVKLSR